MCSNATTEDFVYITPSFDVTMNSNGFPAISLFTGYLTDDGPVRGLEMIICLNTDCSDVDVNSIDEPNVGLSNNIHISGTGLPVFTYLTNFQGGIKIAQCMDIKCDNNINISTVTAPTTKSLNSVIGIDGHLLLLHSSNDTNALYATYCFDMACTQFNRTFIGNFTFTDSGLTISGDGKPIFVVANQVFHCEDVQCSTFTVSATSLQAGGHVSISIDLSGFPIIAAPQINGIMYYHCLDHACSKFTASQVSSLPGMVASVTLGSDGLAFLANVNLMNDGFTTLNTIHCGNAMCTPWS